MAKSTVTGGDVFLLEEDLLEFSLLLPLNELEVNDKTFFLIGLITKCTGSFLVGLNHPGGELLAWVGELLNPALAWPGIIQLIGGMSSGLGDTLMSLPLNLR